MVYILYLYVLIQPENDRAFVYYLIFKFVFSSFDFFFIAAHQLMNIPPVLHGNPSRFLTTLKLKATRARMVEISF